VEWEKGAMERKRARLHILSSVPQVPSYATVPISYSRQTDRHIAAERGRWRHDRL